MLNNCTTSVHLLQHLLVSAEYLSCHIKEKTKNCIYVAVPAIPGLEEQGHLARWNPKLRGVAVQVQTHGMARAVLTLAMSKEETAEMEPRWGTEPWWGAQVAPTAWALLPRPLSSAAGTLLPGAEQCLSRAQEQNSACAWCCTWADKPGQHTKPAQVPRHLCWVNLQLRQAANR